MNYIKEKFGEIFSSKEKRFDFIIYSVLIFIGIVFIAVVSAFPTSLYHELDSYALPTISLQYRGSFVMHPSDLELARRDFPVLYEGIFSYDDLRSAKLVVSPTDPDTWYSYYFPVYSLLCLPVKFIMQLFGLAQDKCFVITNIILFISTCVYIYKELKNTKFARLSALLFVFLSPIWAYVLYVSAETMMFCCIAVAIVAYLNGKYALAGLTVSIASMANPTILAFGLVMVVDYIVKVLKERLPEKDIKLKEKLTKTFFELARVGVCYLPVFIPMIFNLIAIGKLNETAGGADFKEPHYRFLMYLFDINLGFAGFALGALVIALAVLPICIRKKKFKHINIYIGFFATVFCYSIMKHINCGFFMCARYVIWTLPFVAILAGDALCTVVKGIKIKYAAVALSAAMSAVMLLTNVTGMMGHYQLNRVSVFVLDNFPALYSPLHSTFNSRVNQLDGGYWLDNYVVYLDSKDKTVRKVLVLGTREAKEALSDAYKTKEGDGYFEKRVQGVPEDGKYHYISISPLRGDVVYNVKGENERVESSIRIRPGKAFSVAYGSLAVGAYTLTLTGGNIHFTDVQITVNGAPVATETVSADNNKRLLAFTVDAENSTVEIKTVNGDSYSDVFIKHQILNQG